MWLQTRLPIHRHGALHQQATQIPLSHFGNGIGTVPSARAVLSRRDPDPGGKFPTVPEVRHVRRIGGQRKRRDGSDAGNRHQAPSGFQRLHVYPDPGLQLLDDLVHVIHRREQRLQRETRRLGHRTIVILDHLSQATDVRHALGGRHAVLRQRTADRIRQLRALPNQQAAGPKQGRLRLRRGALHRHFANRHAARRLDNRRHLVLPAFDERLDVMRRQQLHRVTELADFTPPVMRTAADFQRHGAGCLLRQKLQKPAARACLAKYRWPLASAPCRAKPDLAVSTPIIVQFVMWTLSVGASSACKYWAHYDAAQIGGSPLHRCRSRRTRNG